MIGLHTSAEVGHSVYLVTSLQRRSPFTQIINVAIIHADDKIEHLKVVRFHRGETDVSGYTPGERHAHAFGNRAIPLMITQYTGRINLEQIIQPPLFN